MKMIPGAEIVVGPRGRQIIFQKDLSLDAFASLLSSMMENGTEFAFLTPITHHLQIPVLTSTTRQEAGSGECHWEIMAGAVVFMSSRLRWFAGNSKN